MLKITTGFLHLLIKCLMAESTIHSLNRPRPFYISCSLLHFKDWTDLKCWTTPSHHMRMFLTQLPHQFSIAYKTARMSLMPYLICSSIQIQSEGRTADKALPTCPSWEDKAQSFIADPWQWSVCDTVARLPYSRTQWVLWVLALLAEAGEWEWHRRHDDLKSCERWR